VIPHVAFYFGSLAANDLSNHALTLFLFTLRFEFASLPEEMMVMIQFSKNRLAPGL
jgi:hypothetical protein